MVVGDVVAAADVGAIGNVGVRCKPPGTLVAAAAATASGTTTPETVARLEGLRLWPCGVPVFVGDPVPGTITGAGVPSTVLALRTIFRAPGNGGGGFQSVPAASNAGRDGLAVGPRYMASGLISEDTGI